MSSGNCWRDWVSKHITFLAMLLAYTHDSQLTVSFNGLSASGKTYITTVVASLFPEDDTMPFGRVSPTALTYKADEVDEETGASILNLSRKILIFYEVLGPEIQRVFRSVLSHDSWDNRSLITNKDKGKNVAQEFILRGYPVAVFCSANLTLDEQEATRAILLSPSVDNEKLLEAINFTAKRKSGDIEFLKKLEANPDIKRLKERIIDIRAAEIDDIFIPNDEVVTKRFLKLVGIPKPRHSRDVEHLFSLIKAMTLLNVWHRRSGDKVVANQSDIDQAFQLWEKIAESQNQNLSPYLLDFYRQIIEPAYRQKLADPEFAEDMKIGAIGLTWDDIADYILQVNAHLPTYDYWRNNMKRQLISSGLITERKAHKGDGRKPHVFLVNLENKNKEKTDKD